MTRYGPFRWKHGGLKIVVALMLIGFLPACDHAGSVSAFTHSMRAGAAGRKAVEKFRIRHAIFIYRARHDGQYNQPVIEKRVVVLT